MPPLLLDDDEAVAVAIGLRTATQGAVAGIEETSLRALAKLEQVLPPRLRRQVSTLQGVTVQVAARAAGPDRGPGDAHRDRPPRARPLHAPVRLLRPAAGGLPAAGRAVPDRQRRPALVPRGVGPGPGGLADVPRGPHARGDVAGSAVHAARADRRRRRGPRRPRRSRRGAPAPGPGHRPRAGGAARWSGGARGSAPSPAIDDASCVIHTGADTVEQLAAWLGDARRRTSGSPSRRSSSKRSGRCPLATRRRRPERCCLRQEGEPSTAEWAHDVEMPAIQGDDRLRPIAGARGRRSRHPRRRSTGPRSARSAHARPPRSAASKAGRSQAPPASSASAASSASIP